MTGIVILNYNSAGLVQNCLQSVAQYNTAPIRIVIVDNASTADGEWQQLQAIAGQYNATLLRSNENLGYARGNNLGLEELYKDESVEYVMVLNSDILFRMDVIPTLIQKLNAIPDCGLISPLMGEKSGENVDITCARRRKTKKSILMQYATLSLNLFGIINKRHHYEFMLLSNPELMDKEYFQVGLPSGSCFLAKKELMQEVGGFDPNTFLYYEEDILSCKLASVGKHNYLVPSLRVRHLGSGSTRKMPRIELMKTERQSLLYYLRNYTSANFIYIQTISLLTCITIKLRYKFR